MAIRYYVGFMVTSYGTTRTGGREVTCRHPLRSMDDIHELQKQLGEVERGDVFVFGFSILHDDEPAAAATTESN